jgi:hypothetical protein
MASAEVKTSSTQRKIAETIWNRPVMVNICGLWLFSSVCVLGLEPTTDNNLVFEKMQKMSKNH